HERSAGLGRSMALDRLAQRGRPAAGPRFCGLRLLRRLGRRGTGLGLFIGSRSPALRGGIVRLVGLASHWSSHPFATGRFRRPHGEPTDIPGSLFAIVRTANPDKLTVWGEFFLARALQIASVAHHVKWSDTRRTPAT